MGSPLENGVEATVITDPRSSFFFIFRTGEAGPNFFFVLLSRPLFPTIVVVAVECAP